MKQKILIAVEVFVIVGLSVGIARYFVSRYYAGPYVTIPVSIDDAHFEKLAWRHDLKPLQHIFGNIEGMEKCYWQKATINQNDRPCEVYRGFIVLKQADFKKLKAEYRWETNGGDLLTEVASEATGYHNFKWSYNQDFDNKVIPSGFDGGLRLDLQNGVIYFYLDDGR